MATILQAGINLLGEFNSIFTALLIFAVLYAILQKTKAVTDNGAINAIIAIVVAFLVVLSETVTALINFMIPWFAVLFIFLLLVLLVFQMFGVTDFQNAVKDPTLLWSIIGISIVIVLAAFGSVFGDDLAKAAASNQNVTSTGSGEFATNVYAILFHPKILGLIVLFGISIFAIVFLTGNQPHK